MALREELVSQGNILFKYRSYIPLALLVVGLGLKVYHVHYLGENHDVGIPYYLKIGSVFVGLLGLYIRVLAVGNSHKNTSGRNTGEGQVAENLNTTGIYSIMRNPLYLGNYFMWLAAAMLTGNIWFLLVFSLVFWIYYERIVYTEENFLRDKFGDSYLNWANKTPIFLPKSFKTKKPLLPFSWKKVLKQEKNGLFALFLLFYVFDVVEEKTWDIEERWKLIAAVATGVIYLVLKYMKKSGMLKEAGR